MNTPVVLFRDRAKHPVALLDACGHRRAPLSGGRVVDDHIECPFHGWRYDAQGVCRAIPALPDGCPTARLGKIPAFPVLERQGFLWVFIGDEAQESAVEPHRFPCSKYSTSAPHVHYRSSFEGDYLTIVETNLDCTHTGFVHAGLLRDQPRQKIDVEVRRKEERVEFHLSGEKGLAGPWFALVRKLAGTQSQTLRHVDRFILPSISETTYEYGPRFAFTFSEALTPVSSERTDLFGCMTVRLPVPAPRRVVEAFLRRQTQRIFRQDQQILKSTYANTKLLADAKLAHSKADVYRHEVAYMLRQAQRDRKPETAAEAAADARVRHVELLI